MSCIHEKQCKEEQGGNCLRWNKDGTISKKGIAAWGPASECFLFFKYNSQLGDSQNVMPPTI